MLPVLDVDEIRKPDMLPALRNCEIPERVTMHSYFSYFSFQWLSREEGSISRPWFTTGLGHPGWRSRG